MNSRIRKVLFKQQYQKCFSQLIGKLKKLEKLNFQDVEIYKKDKINFYLEKINLKVF
jgi:hypothetical protein